MSDAKTLEVYFDFSSPYGFFATKLAEDLAKDIGRELVWKPWLMGAAMKITGIPVQTAIPLKGDYMQKDLVRYAKRFGLRLTMPQGFPFVSVAACRARYAIGQDTPAMVGPWCKAAAAKAWEEGKNLSELDVIAEVARDLGLDDAILLERLQDQEIKDLLKREVDHAIKRGLWGSPHFIVDGTDMFFGCDKSYEIRALYGS